VAGLLSLNFAFPDFVYCRGCGGRFDVGLLIGLHLFAASKVLPGGGHPDCPVVYDGLTSLAHLLGGDNGSLDCPDRWRLARGSILYRAWW